MGDLETKTNSMNFDSIKKYAKKIGLLASASALFFLAGCAQELIQYKARVKTKPAAEVNIYMDGELKGRTSMKEPVYVGSKPVPKNSKCVLSLQRNKYNSKFILNYLEDIKGLEFEQIVTLNPERMSENCLEAKVKRWEKGPSYDLLFEIPRNMILEIDKPESPEPKEESEKSLEPVKKTGETTPKKSENSADIEKFLDDGKPIEFFAAVGGGNAFGGIGISGGILYNFDRKFCAELSAGLGYLLFQDSELNTLAIEGSAALHFKYFREWSGYWKLFGGIQGKAIIKTGTRISDSTLLAGFGLVLGHRWVYKDYFVFADTGFRIVEAPRGWHDKPTPFGFAFDIGVGMKF